MAEVKTLTPEQQKQKFHRWSIVLCVLAFIINYFSIALGGDIYNILVLQFPDYTKTQISSIMSYGSMVAIPLFFFGGTAMRKISPKYIMTPALFLGGIMLIWMPHTSSYGQLAVCVLLMTVGMKIFDFCIYGIVSNWFITTRGRILGYITIATPFASATFTNFSTRLSDVFGPIPVFGAFGAFVVVIGVLSWFFCPGKPEEKGLQADGVVRTKEELEALNKKPAPSMWTTKQILTNKAFWLYTVAFGIFALLMAAVMPLFVARMLSVGVERSTALNLMSIASVAGMFISAIWGWVDDKFGTPVACTALGISYCIMMIAIRLQAPGSIWLYLSVFGVAFGTGGVPNLCPSMCCHIFGRDQYMNIMRISQPIQQLIRLISLFMMAWFFDTFGSYDHGYEVCAVLAIISVVLLLFVRNTTYASERLEAEELAKNA